MHGNPPSLMSPHDSVRHPLPEKKRKEKQLKTRTLHKTQNKTGSCISCMIFTVCNDSRIYLRNKLMYHMTLLHCLSLNIIPISSSATVKGHLLTPACHPVQAEEGPQHQGGDWGEKKQQTPGAKKGKRGSALQ